MHHAQAITHLRSLAGIRYSTTYAPLNVHAGDQAPHTRGEDGYHTTPSGKTIVHHPTPTGGARSTTTRLGSSAWVVIGSGRRPSESPLPRAVQRSRSSLSCRMRRPR